MTIVVPWKLSTGINHDYLFYYYPLVGILFEVLRIVVCCCIVVFIKFEIPPVYLWDKTYTEEFVFNFWVDAGEESYKAVSNSIKQPIFCSALVFLKCEDNKCLFQKCSGFLL